MMLLYNHFVIKMIKIYKTNRIHLINPLELRA